MRDEFNVSIRKAGGQIAIRFHNPQRTRTDNYEIGLGRHQFLKIPQGQNVASFAPPARADPPIGKDNKIRFIGLPVYHHASE